MAPTTAHRDPRGRKTASTSTSSSKGRSATHGHITGVSRPQHRNISRPIRRLDALEVELLFEIVEWLDVKDALRLRLVCRHLAEIAHLAPSIWKRYMRTMKAPLPYSPKPIPSLTSPEVIKLIRRANNLEYNWNHGLSYVYSHAFYPLERPYLVRVAPGGRFVLAACVSNGGEHHGISIYDIENPYGMVCLASCTTQGYLKTLSVSWMEVTGTDGPRIGIAVGWVREFELGAQPDAGQANTEVATAFISLEILEWLADPYNWRKPNPFELLFHRYYRTRWCEIALDAGLLAVAHEPQNISVYKVATQEKAAIILQPLGNGVDPCIFAIKLVHDNSIFVIRGESKSSKFHVTHAMEMYPLPLWGEIRRGLPALGSFTFPSDANDYKISGMYKRQPTTANPTVEEFYEAKGYLVPIVILVTAAQPADGISHFRLMPQTDPPDPVTGHVMLSYKWPPKHWTGQYSEADRRTSRTVLVPGVDRSLGFPFNVPGRHSLTKAEDFMILGTTTGGDIPSVLLPKEVYGVGAVDVSWDEGSGKIAIAAADDSRVWIIDYGV